MPTVILRALQTMDCGVIDTSTLIYLERLGLLPLTSRAFKLHVIPQVAVEYGGMPAATVPVPSPGTGPTDELLCQAAYRLGLPVLSEDRRVLRRANALHLPSYNTLMIVLALCVQGSLPTEAFPMYRQHLRSFARYGRQIFATGDRLFDILVREEPAKRGDGTLL